MYGMSVSSPHRAPERPGGAEERRAHILAATVRLIAAGGVDTVRYRTVADAAAVPLGTVTYHFASRDELIRAALTHYLAENTRALLALRTELQGTTVNDVASYMVELLRRDLADPERKVIAEYELIVFAARDPEVAAALHRWERAMLAELARTLEGLGVAAPFAAARTLADMLRGFELMQLSRSGADLDDFRQRLCTVLAAHMPQERKTRR
jgi:TetR/AcrR family transcriptional regulator, regulator of biofilm formation and stress response